MASRIGPQAEANIIEAIAAGELKQAEINKADLRRINELLRQYANLHSGEGLSLADASIVAVAERLKLTDVATLDVTDFSIAHPNHIKHFTLLPE